ncbi:MAG: hypothetical protein HY791_31575 [Deltaproteobacteria bacterium]|nr:hypothetical protein [Deltaproteobacteria bacterium]
MGLLCVLLSFGVSVRSEAKPDKAQALAKKLGVTEKPIEEGCKDPNAGAACAKRALDRIRGKLEVAAGGKGVAKILHLGDSHIAADYISGTVRAELQKKFKDGGRGFIPADQKSGFGGRRLGGEPKGWERDRVVDLESNAGRNYGFSGTAYTSKDKDAELTYELAAGEKRVGVWYQQTPEGGKAKLLVGKTVVGELDARGDEQSTMKSFSLKAPAKKGNKLVIKADGPNVRVFGLSFETEKNGLQWISIGPVGADAKVYLQLGQKSFEQNLKQLDPDLVILMVGGNDALKMRKGRTDMDRVTKDHADVLFNLRRYLPDSDCLVWSPMDAGVKEDGKVVSKALLKEVRDMQRELAVKNGCAFWDLYEAMGGEGSIARWVSSGVMNEDLVHPKAAAAEALGRMFVEPFVKATAN